MTPLLILLFGVHPLTAVGTDLLFAATTKTAGTAIHSKNGNVDWRVAGLLAAGSVPATVLTIWVLVSRSISKSMRKRPDTGALPNCSYGVHYDLHTWRRYVSAAGFVELSHYYRPAGLPRERQPWLASV